MMRHDSPGFGPGSVDSDSSETGLQPLVDDDSGAWDSSSPGTKLARTSTVAVPAGRTVPPSGAQSRASLCGASTQKAATATPCASSGKLPRSNTSAAPGARASKWAVPRAAIPPGPVACADTTTCSPNRAELSALTVVLEDPRSARSTVSPL